MYAYPCCSSRISGCSFYYYRTVAKRVADNNSNISVGSRACSCKIMVASSSFGGRSIVRSKSRILCRQYQPPQHHARNVTSTARLLTTKSSDPFFTAAQQGLNRRYCRRYASSKTQQQDQSSTHNSRESSSFSAYYFLASFFSWYSNKLDTHPLLAKGITSGLISGAGDIICQVITAATTDATVTVAKDKGADSSLTSSSSFCWDWKRTGRFFVLGAALVAPIVHWWYAALATKILPGNSANVSLVIKRVLTDQLVFAPPFCCAWLVSLWALEELTETETSNKLNSNNKEGSTAASSSRNEEESVPSFWQRTQDQLIESVPTIVVANWVLWIPAMAVNFRFVAIKYQVLYSNVVALLWNVYLSHSTSNSNSIIDESNESNR